MNLATVKLRKAVIKNLRHRFPALQECKAQPGVFSISENESTVFRTPSLRVAVLDIKRDDSFSDTWCSLVVRMVTYVIVRKANHALLNDDTNINIVEDLLGYIDGQVWQSDDVFPASNVRAENLYSQVRHVPNMMLWSVMWEQKIHSHPMAEKDGQLPTQLYLGMAPDIGAEHEQSYYQISGKTAKKTS